MVYLLRLVDSHTKLSKLVGKYMVRPMDPSRVWVQLSHENTLLFSIILVVFMRDPYNSLL